MNIELGLWVPLAQKLGVIYMINLANEVRKNPEILQKVLIIKGEQIVKICSTYKEAIQLAKNQEDLSIYKVPKNIDAIRILPLYRCSDKNFG
jgi:uncharacterized metal-binding protein